MLYRLASMSWMNLINGVRTPCEQARAEAGDDPELQCEIHQDLAWVAFYLGDLDEAMAEARAAVDWVATETGTMARADAIATLAFIEFVRGDSDPAALVRGRRPPGGRHVHGLVDGRLRLHAARVDPRARAHVDGPAR